MKNFKENRGFTLIEIIVVIAIIGIGIVPILNYFTNSISHIQEVEIRSQAFTIAGDVLELVKQETNTDLSYLTNHFNNSSDSNTAGSKDKEILDNIESNYDFLADFSMDISISNFKTNTDIKEVVVKVLWDSENKSEELKTIIRDRTGDE